ncbi:glycosyltransferase family 2 protein [Agrobacterium rubi]|nr:glycosyltransferase family 2 protein [Agrobacterium rubi]NTF24673.1 glycosyltransferase family 2 protein [Agrobacterium rubi]
MAPQHIRLTLGSTSKKDTIMPKVAVITRTKNRIIMLSRAARSVSAQTFRDFIWVVVNDGGDAAEVDRLVDLYRASMPEVVVVHHAVNKGMEAASNAGIAASSSEFLVIHDDDDTWEPTFLERAVGFLEQESKIPFGGVVTAITHVDEEMTEKEVVIRATKPWHPTHSAYPVGAIQLADLCVINQFAPIAFVFRRSVYDEIGGYDESLPVLGDWEFNLRFVARYDIAALPDLLANYHHRPASKNSYGNSVLAGALSHVAYDAVLRNRIIRNAKDPRYSDIADLVAQGRSTLQVKAYGSGVVDLTNRLLGYLVPMAKKARAAKRKVARLARKALGR